MFGVTHTLYTYTHIYMHIHIHCLPCHMRVMIRRWFCTSWRKEIRRGCTSPPSKKTKCCIELKFTMHISLTNWHHSEADFVLDLLSNLPPMSCNPLHPLSSITHSLTSFPFLYVWLVSWRVTKAIRLPIREMWGEIKLRCFKVEEAPFADIVTPPHWAPWLLTQ